MTARRWSPEELEWQSAEGYLVDALESLWLELERYRYSRHAAPLELIQAHALVEQLLRGRQETDPPADER